MSNNTLDENRPLSRKERAERRARFRARAWLTSGRASGEKPHARPSLRTRPEPAMPEQVSVCSALLLNGAKVTELSGAGVPSRHVRVGGRTFLRLHYVAARNALRLAAAARRGYVEKGLVRDGVSLRQYLAGALSRWLGLRDRSRT